MVSQIAGLDGGDNRVPPDRLLPLETDFIVVTRSRQGEGQIHQMICYCEESRFVGTTKQSYPIRLFEKGSTLQ